MYVLTTGLYAGLEQICRFGIGFSVYILISLQITDLGYFGVSTRIDTRMEFL